MKKLFIVLFAISLFHHFAAAQWVQQTSGVNVSLQGVSIPTLNPTTGYVCGASGTILKTTSTGANWSPQFSGTLETLKDIDFANNTTGVAVGFNGVISRTTNGGTNWVVQFFGGFDIYSVQFITQTTGFAYGESGLVIRTTNSGANWSALVVSGIDGYSGNFFNSTTGLVCGYFGSNDYRMRMTTNSGSNWTQVYSSGNIMRSVHFYDENTGWLVGSNGLFARTVNGGAFWTGSFPFSTNNFNDIYFSTVAQLGNGLDGWICADSGKILHTTNGISLWTSQPTPTSNNLRAIEIIGNLIGYCVGDGGTILYTNTGGAIGIQQISTEIPSRFELSQNYPNPFNPATNIEFKIAKSGLVNLTIYDAMGREVETLVNSELNLGTYKADWDASNMVSGVYFCRLSAEDFSETKRMVLIK